MKILIALALSLAVAGCSIKRHDSTPIESPSLSAQPKEPHIAHIYLLIEQARLEASEAAKKGLISKDEADYAVRLYEVQRETLDRARDAYVRGDMEGARRGAEMIDVIMNQVRRDVQQSINQTQLRRQAIEEHKKKTSKKKGGS